MHLIERGKIAKPLNINTNGVNKKIKHFLCVRVSTFAKPECDNVLQPDPRINEGCSTFLDEGFAEECNIAIILYKCLLYNLRLLFSNNG